MMELEQSYISKVLETAIVAARLAGQRAMEDIRYTKSSVKNGNEMVTEADKACQEIIINRIKETFPDHGFIGEEGADGKIFVQPPRCSEEIWWVIDPIDGTNNYALGIMNFCVVVGAMYKNKPIVGVIFEPATENMYTAAINTDTQLNSSRIQASDDDISKLKSVALDSHFTPEQVPAVLELIHSTRYRNLGTTAMHLAYVSKGSFIGAVVKNIKLWELAACSIILENAGGIITDYHGNSLFPINPAEYKGEGFAALAGNKRVHPKLLEIMNRQR